MVGRPAGRPYGNLPQHRPLPTGLGERAHPGPVFLGGKRLDPLAAAASGGGDRRVAPTGIYRSTGPYPRVSLNDLIPGRYSLARNVSIPSLPRPVVGATGGRPHGDLPQRRPLPTGFVERAHPGPVFLGGKRLDPLAAAASGRGAWRVAPTGICRSAGPYRRVLLNEPIPGRYSLASNVSIPALPRPVVGATGGRPYGDLPQRRPYPRVLFERPHPGPVFLGEQRLDTLAATASGRGDRRSPPRGSAAAQAPTDGFC